MSPGKRPRSHESDPPIARYPSEASQQYSIEPVRSAEDLLTLEEDWNRLSESAELPNVFMTYDWFRTWNQRRAREHRRGLRRPEILVLKKDGAVAGIAPLIYRESSRFGFKVRRLESLASPADYYDVVVGDDPARQVDAMIDFLAQTKDQWDLVNLRSLRETGNVQNLIERALSRTKLIYRLVPEERCPYLPIEAGSSLMVSRLSHSSRRTLRRKQHRLERMYAEGLRVRIILNPHEESRLIDRLISVKTQKLVDGKLVVPVLAKYPEVFQSLFDNLGRHGWIYVALMELGNRAIAWLMGFRCGKKLWGYQRAYDPCFSQLSPGTMLFLAILDYGFSHGYEEYDFLTGEEPYKMMWSAGFHKTLWLRIWSRRWVSWAHRAWGKAYGLLDPGE